MARTVVEVRDKYQITLPQPLRELKDIDEGDYIEISVETVYSDPDECEELPGRDPEDGDGPDT